MHRNILPHLISLWCCMMLLWRTDASSNVTTNNDNRNNSHPTKTSDSISRYITPSTSENRNSNSSPVNRSRASSDRSSDITTESSSPMRLFNSNNSIPGNWSKTPISISSICRLTAVDSTLHERIRTLIVDEGVKLLEYHLVFTNYSINPLQAISRYAYKLESWARASSRHGQTLLSLAFNYGILSLRTLSFGTDALIVEMVDTPSGCVVGMDEEEVVAQLLYLLSRDFKDTEEMMLEGEERICHEVIVDVHGYAKFKDQCFKSSGASDELVETDAGNFWINLLYTMLMLVRFGVIFFGPLLLTSAVGKLSRKSIPYVVKLKEPLKKKVVIATLDTVLDKIKAERTIALRPEKGFPKLAKALSELKPTPGQPFDVQIPQYDILVSYKRLLTENRVPVGLWRSIGRAIFYCKIRNVGPFQSCCTVNMFASCPCVDRVTPWSHFWRKVGLALMAVCIPFPWYVRLWIFYSYEYDEVLLRKEATYKVGLKENLDNSLIHFFTPTHWIFTVIYILYFATVIILVYMTRRSEEGRFRKILVGSFSDLENLSWFRVLHMLVSNVIWPFQRFGVCGLFVAVVYWPIVIPITLVAFALYSLPLTYLTIRMFFYSRRMVTATTQKRSGVRTYRDKKQVDETIERFEASSYFGNGLSTKDGGPDDEPSEDDPSFEGDVDLDKIKRKIQPDSISLASSIKSLHGAFRPRRFIENMLASTLCVLSLFSILLILSECLGCLVEIIVFTMMGIIVNASTLLKYVSLVILVVVYSCDSFNNVEKKYLKLNKALFNEVKGRIKDLDKITSLPSNLQENRGFKSQEMSEQGTYESPDEVTQKPALHWFINDLVLFVDNEDMPRIPRKLFDEVCQIKVAGVPGPVYRGLLFGIKQFLKIALFIFFVFIVVLSFGEVYKISSTNQMLATLAGGFLPAILRQFMEPERPDIEIGTVSFKSKLDEIIKNFYQVWPMYDLPLERVPDPEEQPNPDGQEQLKEHPKNDIEKEKKTEIMANNVSILKEDFLNGNIDSAAATSSAEAVLKRDKRVGFETPPESESVDLLILLPVSDNLDTSTLKQNFYDQWSFFGGLEQNDATVSHIKQDIETGSPMLGI